MALNHPVQKNSDHSDSENEDESDVYSDVKEDIPKSLESNLFELASGLAELERECAELLATELCPEDEALLLASLSMVFIQCNSLIPMRSACFHKCVYGIITNLWVTVIPYRRDPNFVWPELPLTGRPEKMAAQTLVHRPQHQLVQIRISAA